MRLGLFPCMVAVLAIHDSADDRIEAHCLPDLGQAGSNTRGKIRQRGLTPYSLNPTRFTETKWHYALPPSSAY